MTDVFDLLETQFSFPGVDSDLLRAQALEHSPCVGEEVGVGFAVTFSESGSILGFLIHLFSNDIQLLT